MVLTAEEAEAVIKTIWIKDFKKGSILLEEGQVAKEGYFILKGCIRKYKVIDGEEKT